MLTMRRECCSDSSKVMSGSTVPKNFSSLGWSITVRWFRISRIGRRCSASVLIRLRSANSVRSSASVWQQVQAAMIEPMLDPEMVRGSRSCSNSVLMTPKWYSPSSAPPDSSSAGRP